jgi:hypothetical protein
VVVDPAALSRLLGMAPGPAASGMVVLPLAFESIVVELQS